MFSISVTSEYINYFQEPLKRRFSLGTLGFILASITFFSNFITRQFMMRQLLIVCKLTFEITVFLYDKILKITPSNVGHRSSFAEIINHVDIDASQLASLANTIPQLVVNPITIIVYMIALFKFYGFAFVFGLATFLFFLIINWKIQLRMTEEAMKGLTAKDERLKITVETFESIKLLKLYNWEDEFKKRIFEKYDKEIAFSRNFFKFYNIIILIYNSAPIWSSVSTIGFYQYLNKDIDVTHMLIGLTIFSTLQTLIGGLPELINSMIQAINSTKRVQVKYFNF